MESLLGDGRVIKLVLALRRAVAECRMDAGVVTRPGCIVEVWGEGVVETTVGGTEGIREIIYNLYTTQRELCFSFTLALSSRLVLPCAKLYFPVCVMCPRLFLRRVYAVEDSACWPRGHTSHSPTADRAPSADLRGEVPWIGLNG
jgi:hypothetical protein